MAVRSLEKYSRLFLLALLAFAVLWRGGKGIEATWLLIAVGCLMVFAEAYVHRKSEPGRDVPVLLWSAAMLFLLWTVLSFIFSLTRNYGLDEVLRDGTLILLLIWTVRWKQDREGKNHPFVANILRTIVFLTFLACAVGIGVYVFQPVNRFVGSFFYFLFSTDYWPNAWAEYLLLAWPVVLLWSLHGEGRLRLLRYALLGGVLGCFFLSYSRGAAIAFAGQVALLAVFFILRAGWRKIFRTAIRPFLVTAVLALVTFMGINALRLPFHPVESVTRKITFTAAEGSSSFTERAAFMKQAVTLTLMRPLLGWGPYSFRFTQPRLQTEILQTSDHPHNLFLKLAAERGIAAALLFLILLGAILLPAGVRLFRKRRAESEDHVQILLFIAVLGVLAHNLIDYNLQFVGIALPFFLFLGMVTPAASRLLSPRTRRVMHSLEIFLAAVVLIVAVVEGRFLITSSLGRHAEAAGNISEAQEWYVRSTGDLFQRDLLLSRTLLYLKQNAYIDAERTAREYLRVNGEDARGWKTLGETDLRLFHSREALEAFRQAYLLARWNDAGIVRGYLQALVNAQRMEEIGAEHEEFIRLMHAYADAITNNTHFIALSGNVEQFSTLSRIAAAAYPSDAERIREWARTAEQKVQKVREGFSARRPGYLW